MTPRPRDLITAEARALRQALEAMPDTADAGGLAALRAAHPDADPSLISALATQVRLQRRAVDRLGPWATELILDEEALQQATRRDVARYRAAQVVGQLAREAPTVADIGCGLGIDARALAEAGCRVIAIERDPWRAEAAEVNLTMFAERVHVLRQDATTLDNGVLAACDAAYVDPARRAPGGPRRIDGGRARAVASPDAWSPPWSFVTSLAERMPVVAKVAPGFDPRMAPGGADIEWIDHGGDTVEATGWLGAFGHGTRRATAVDGERWETVEAPRTGSADPPASTSRAGTLLIEATPAVIRADLVDALAARLGAARLDDSTWLTADTSPETLLARTWRIREEIPSRPRELRATLRGRGSVTWKTADTSASATEWERRVGHRPGEGPSATVVITGRARTAGGSYRAFEVERSHA